MEEGAEGLNLLRRWSATAGAEPRPPRSRPGCVTPPGTRPSPLRRTRRGDGGGRRQRCLIGLPGLAGDLAIGDDRPFGGWPAGPRTAGSSRRRTGGRASALLSKPIGPSRSSSTIVVEVQPAGGVRHRSRLLGAVELRGSEAGADEGTDDPSWRWICRAFSFSAVPSAWAPWAMCSWVASRMPS